MPIPMVPSFLFRTLRNWRPLARSLSLNDATNSLQRVSETESDSLYTKEQEIAILKTINECSAEEIVRFEVTKSLAQRLEDYRNSNGHFQTLQDVLKVKGIGTRSIEKLCINILNPPKNDDMKEKKKRENVRFLLPNLEPEVKENLQNAVGIHIGPQLYSWASIDRFGHLQSWDCAELTIPKKLHITNTYQSALNIQDTLPPATIYLMEDRLISLHSKEQMSLTPFVVYQLQLVAMLVTLLNTKSKNSTTSSDVSDTDTPSSCFQQTVYFMQPRLTSRLFDVMVGSERVSTQGVVQDILSFSVASHFSPITFLPELKDNYISRNALEKETMCLSLLITMAFFDLVVHKTPESLKAVSKKMYQK